MAVQSATRDFSKVGALKFRQRFDEVRVTGPYNADIVKNAVSNQRVAHAIIFFCGPRVGRQDLDRARITGQRPSTVSQSC